MYNKFSDFLKLCNQVDDIANNKLSFEDHREKIKIIHKYRNQLQGWILTILSLNINGKLSKDILEIYGDGAIKISKVDKCYINQLNSNWKQYKEKKFLKDYEDLFYLGSKNDSPRRFHYTSISSTFYLLTRYMREEDSNNVYIILDILCKLLNIDSLSKINKQQNKKSLINKVENSFKTFILDFSYVNKKKTPLMINIVNILIVFLDYFNNNRKVLKYLDFYYDFIQETFLNNNYYVYFNNIKLKFRFRYELKYELKYLKERKSFLSGMEKLDKINEVNMINDIFIDNISYLSSIDDSNMNELLEDVNYLFNYIIENEMNCNKIIEEGNKRKEKDFLSDFKSGDLVYKLTFIMIFNTLYSNIGGESNMNINLELCVFEKVKMNDKILPVNNTNNARNHLEKIIFDKRVDIENLENIDSDFNINLSTITLNNELETSIRKEFKNNRIRRNLSIDFEKVNRHLYQ